MFVKPLLLSIFITCHAEKVFFYYLSLSREKSVFHATVTRKKVCMTKNYSTCTSTLFTGTCLLMQQTHQHDPRPFFQPMGIINMTICWSEVAVLIIALSTLQVEFYLEPYFTRNKQWKIALGDLPQISGYWLTKEYLDHLAIGYKAPPSVIGDNDYLATS